MNQIPSRPIVIQYTDPDAVSKRRIAQTRYIDTSTEEIESEDYCTIEVASPAPEGN